jgi:aryl-alcohol dehydrogenase
MAARIVGANPIIAVDMNPKRLALGRKLGAAHALNNTKTDVTEKIRAIVGGGPRRPQQLPPRARGERWVT